MSRRWRRTRRSEDGGAAGQGGCDDELIPAMSSAAAINIINDAIFNSEGD